MKYLYVIWDNVALESGPIYEAKNNGIALRQYQAMMQNEQLMNMDDYKLLRIGQINHQTNQIYPQDQQTEITVTLDMVDQLEEKDA